MSSRTNRSAMQERIDQLVKDNLSLEKQLAYDKTEEFDEYMNSKKTEAQHAVEGQSNLVTNLKGQIQHVTSTYQKLAAEYHKVKVERDHLREVALRHDSGTIAASHYQAFFAPATNIEHQTFTYNINVAVPELNNSNTQVLAASSPAPATASFLAHAAASTVTLAHRPAPHDRGPRSPTDGLPRRPTYSTLCPRPAQLGYCNRRRCPHVHPNQLHVYKDVLPTLYANKDARDADLADRQQ